MNKLLTTLAILAFLATPAWAAKKITELPDAASVDADDEFECSDSTGPTSEKCDGAAIQTFVLTGEAATATALAANGGNCSAGQYPLGVDASGAVESCTAALSNVVEDVTPQLGAQLDVNGFALGDGMLELLDFVETGSAVNHIEITNAATAGDPKIAAAGDDTDIDLELAGQGTGAVRILSALDKAFQVGDATNPHFATFVSGTTGGIQFGRNAVASTGKLYASNTVAFLENNGAITIKSLSATGSVILGAGNQTGDVSQIYGSTNIATSSPGQTRFQADLNTTRDRDGTPFFLEGGDGGATDRSGGDVVIFGGDQTGSGVVGDVVLAHDGTSAVGNVGIGTDSPTSGLTMGNDKLIARDTNATITASTTQTQGQNPLTAEVNEISTVANTNDVCGTLIAAAAGLKQLVINKGANTCQIFPASGDDLGSGVDTATTLGAGLKRTFDAYDATNWGTGISMSSLEVLGAVVLPAGSIDAGDLDTNYESELDNSAGLLAALSDETGSGLAVFSTSPTFSGGVTVGGDLTMTSGFMEQSVTAGITASTTQTQGQGALTSQINEISIVANPDDTVTLPAAVGGLPLTIINNGDNNLQFFPASGDDTGVGVNLAQELEPNESITLIAFDSTNWHTTATTEIAHAEMKDEDNTDVFVMNDAGGDFHSLHTNGMVENDGAGWTFDAGGAGTSFPIASVANSVGSPGTQILVTTTGSHLLAVGDIISQTNLADSAYVGIFKVVATAAATTYEVAAVFTATGTGTMDQAATLTCGTGFSGAYHIVWFASATSSSNNETFDFEVRLETARVTIPVTRKFGTAADFGSFSGGGIVDIVDGEKISMSLSNQDSAGNVTLRHFTIVLTRL